MKTKLTVTYVILSVFALGGLLPVLWMFVMSLQTPRALNSFPTLNWFKDFEFNNYQIALNQGGIYQGLINSSIITGGTLIISVTFATLAAYALANFEFKGKALLLIGILMTQLIPGMAAIVPLFDILKSLHLINTYTGLILIFAARTIPLNIWIMHGFFKELPAELREAAIIDGCSVYTTFTRIILPLALPGIGAACMFTFMQTWIDFIMPLTTLFDQNKFPFTVMLYKYVGDPIMGTNYGVVFASAVIGTLPTLLMFVFFQRFFVKGLTSGAVKG
ncbi:carbohydrate ABC transporter permease [Sporolactobacillus shoreae]|uniref:Carbohydrate ABC transporter permease n=1 Tax=Sporolactobacillus shoreae TaxID=1465501 RepID=A0A4Z0GR63_9BACL|nr:carbohydrate ABC transporter permease [Sporolactobacillus shoreae]TGA99830.1 carbohydrate ABC transporter permease [Sporolactobacillus shoreae]